VAVHIRSGFVYTRLYKNRHCPYTLNRDYTGKRNICSVLFTCAVVLVGGSNKTDGQKIYDAFKDNLKRANVSPEVKKDKI